MSRRPIFVASFGAFVAALSTSLVAVSAPVIAKDLHASRDDVNWILTGYLLAVSCLLALVGKAADVLGRKRIYLTGFSLFVIGSFACAAAPALNTLVAARVFQGIGAAMLMAVGPAIVTRAVPPAQRARALGVQLALTYVGLTIGPSAGGFIAGKLGWHAVFVVIGIAGALGAIGGAALLERDDASAGAKPDDKPRPASEKPDTAGAKPDAELRPASAGAGTTLASLDLAGAVAFAVTLAALLVALHRVRAEGWSRTVLGILAVGIVALVVFVRHSARAQNPVLPLELFRKPPFAFGVVGATLLYTVTFMLSAWLLPFYLQRAGLKPQEAGAYLTAQPVVMAFVAPMSGAIADRWGPRIPSAAGMLAIGAGMLLVARAADTRGVPLVLALGLIGLGAGLYVAPNSALIMGSAPRERQSTAGAMAATARNVGMTLGVALGATLDRAFGFGPALTVAAALAAAGVVLGLVRPVVTSPA